MLRLLLGLVVALVIVNSDWWTAAFSWIGDVFGAAEPDAGMAGVAVVEAGPSSLFWPLWLVGALLVPPATMSVIRGVVRRKSNILNVYIVLVYLAVDLGIALALMALGVGEPSHVLLLIVAAFSLAYTLLSMRVALYLET
ncbi:MAG: hypothetical protein ACWA6X_04450 [Bauldia sp.]